MTIKIGPPVPGERLFLAFVQPCLDARMRVSKMGTGSDGPVFTKQVRDQYVSWWKHGIVPPREVLARDFPTPTRELVAYAAECGVVDPDQVWAHDMVADFWRNVHHRSDPQCRVIPACVISTQYPDQVVSVLSDAGDRMFVVNLLDIPIEEGDQVSIHKLIICERRT